MTHDEAVDMKDFNEWWNADIIRSSPFRRGSPKYWGWAAWQAAAKTERGACAKIIESHGPTLANGLMLTEAIRARGSHD
jgi:hypothetical protein